jgi:hypothetical protein
LLIETTTSTGWPLRFRRHCATLSRRVQTLFIFSLVGLVVNLISDLAYMWMIRGSISSAAVDADHRAPAGRHAAASPLGEVATDDASCVSRRRSTAAAGELLCPAARYWSFWIFAICSWSRCLPVIASTGRS